MDYLIPIIMCVLNLLLGIWLGKRSGDRREYLNDESIKIDDNGSEAILLVEPMKHKGEIKTIVLIEHREGQSDTLKNFKEAWKV